MPDSLASASANSSDGDRIASGDEVVSFAAETDGGETASPSGEPCWKILIVDDDEEVHHVTKLALSDVSFEGRSLAFISAYSAQGAKHMIQAHPDTAIVLLDVVMESEEAGLDVVSYIREELENSIVRIILRTGQPGQAPEDTVAVNYGIDDYKTKTELTSQKLLISVITALRAFSTLSQILDITQVLEQELAHYRETERDGSQRQPDPPADAAAPRGAIALPTPTHPPESISSLKHLLIQADQDANPSSQPSGTIYTMSTMARIARMVLRITDEHSAKLGLSQSKLAVLIYLNAEPTQSTSPSLLAKQCGVSRAAMTGLLDGLEEDGYVERDSHPSDRRALMVKLTPKGQDFLEWLAPQEQYQISEIMGALDEADRKLLMDLMIKTLQFFDETADSANS